MPTPDLTTPGAPTWIDLFTSDTDRAEAFYGGLFGWTFASAGAEFGGYINIFKDGNKVAGCMKNDGSQGTPDMWSIYLRTDDARKLETLAVENGGRVFAPAMDVAGLGVMTLIADCGGASIGAWEPGTHRGFDVVAEHGAPEWFELHTRSYEASLDFYRNVFGWSTRTMSDIPEFRYTALASGPASGDDDLAGIMDVSASTADGEPATWAVYFGVDDTDTSVARAVELGGTVVTAAQDTPYGRLAVIADTTGTEFRLVGPSAPTPA